MAMDTQVWQRHAWTNRLQSLLLVATLLGINALAGMLLLGEQGLWVALGAGLVVLLIEPAASMQFTLRLYGARPLAQWEAPELWQYLDELSRSAGLPAVPVPYYVPSSLVNAFAVGNRQRAAIVLTDGLLRTLASREVAGVLAHELAHIVHGDLRVMGLADFVSRLTSFYAMAGQLLLLFTLPWWLSGAAAVNWPGLLLLWASPYLAALAQLGLSRVREFDADLAAAALTGDPQGLASALARIDRAGRSWRGILLPGWGNPEPSWLRTHPATEERIARLQEMQPPPRAPWETVMRWPPGGKDAFPVRSAPRWRLGGHWW
jgi:heat shock protein HtpX